MNLQQQRRDYVRALDRAVELLPDKLALIPDVRKAILFGSYAAGRRDLGTDLDILIITESSLDVVSRTVELYRRLGLGVDLDIISFTPDELEQVRGRGFVRNALEGGRVIYER